MGDTQDAVIGDGYLCDHSNILRLGRRNVRKCRRLGVVRGRRGRKPLFAAGSDQQDECWPAQAGMGTPFNRVLAIDPETGKEKWTFDPKVDLRERYSEGLVNRGVAFWSDDTGAEGSPCRQRIFMATIDARLFALDAANGHPCTDFGTAGQID